MPDTARTLFTVGAAVLAVVGAIAAGFGLAAAFSHETSRNWLLFAVWAVWTPAMFLSVRRTWRIKRLAWPFGLLGLALALFYGVAAFQRRLSDRPSRLVFMSLATIAFLWLLGALFLVWRDRTRKGKESA